MAKQAAILGVYLLNQHGAPLRVGALTRDAIGATLPAVVAQAAPEGWAWPEKRAAGVLKRDMASAGERLLAVADPQGWRAMQTARSIVDDNRVVITRCARTADKAQEPSRCVILLKPTATRMKSGRRPQA